jgi:hypothetical protein
MYLNVILFAPTQLIVSQALLLVFSEQMGCYFREGVTFVWSRYTLVRNLVDHHTCSIANLLVAHQKMQNDITFIWVVIVAGKC